MICLTLHNSIILFLLLSNFLPYFTSLLIHSYSPLVKSVTLLIPLFLPLSLTYIFSNNLYQGMSVSRFRICCVVLHAWWVSSRYLVFSDRNQINPKFLFYPHFFFKISIDDFSSISSLIHSYTDGSKLHYFIQLKDDQLSSIYLILG